MENSVILLDLAVCGMTRHNSLSVIPEAKTHPLSPSLRRVERNREFSDGVTLISFPAAPLDA